MNRDSTASGKPDLRKFEELFHQNHQFLCMVALKIVHDDFAAKDLVQDFFVKFWEHRDSIELKKFEAYAYRAVKNACYNYLKHQAVEGKHLLKVTEEDLDALDLITEETPNELPEQDKRLKTVLRLLDELPAERRKVFELHALEGLSYQQIADKLGISVNTVKTQLRRSYITLRGKAVVIIALGYLMKYF